MATFRYLSSNTLATMSRIDQTIVPVFTDPPSPLLPAVPEPPPTLSLPFDVRANLRTIMDSNQRTKNQFRPRIGKGGATSYQLRQYAEVTLGGGSLRKVVKLPEGEDENEWLAVNSESGPRIIKYTEWMLTNCSGRLLQPNQSAVRGHYRVLLSTVVSRDEGNRRVRYSLEILIIGAQH